MRVCLSEKCRRLFTPKQSHQKYCSRVCKRYESSIRHWRNNRESMLAEFRQRYADNPDKFKAHGRRMYLQNREIVLQRHKLWASQHRELLRFYSSNRHHKVRANKKGSVTPSEWKTLVEIWGGKCAYCGKEKKLTQDHAIPISKGGEHSLDNIVPACLECNQRKHTKSFEDFMLEMSQ